VSTEENESIQFVDRIEALTEKVLQINAEIDQLDHVKKTIADNRDSIKRFPSLLKTLQPFEPETERIPFRRDIFESAVQSIHMMSKGKILVEFIFDHSETVTIKGYFPHKLPNQSK
jgi:GTP1/Obg family GTP-binding protein